MKRNCNLELRLVTPSVFSDSSRYQQQQQKRDRGGGNGPESSNNPRDKEFTVFYSEKVSVSDMTELQARTIILLASGEATEDKSPLNPTLNSPVYSPTTGHSLKRSLQRFLQKRKSRAGDTSPYPNLSSTHYCPYDN